MARRPRRVVFSREPPQCGQFVLYRALLKREEPDRALYPAVSRATYSAVFRESDARDLIPELQLRIVEIDPMQEMVTRAMNRAVEIIKEFLREYAETPPAVGDIEMETVLDDARGHYELRMQGWNQWKRVHGSVVHVDVRNGKIYVQHDGTEEGIANRLTEGGVPADRIVLCFHHPDERAYTPFAVA